MIEKSPIVATLDANVLYPAPLRDFLLNIAATELFQPKWNLIIQQEWKYNLLKNRPDLKEAQLNRTIKLMESAFPEASTKIQLETIDKIEIPDENDKHVISSAIESNSNYIVTWNIKDFPKNILQQFSIEAIKPDKFIEALVKIDREKVATAFTNQLSSLKHPKLSKDQLVQILKKNGLKEIDKQLNS
ncbi:PIN domain-containing protein [Portibacter marinus]|uniref:PIN domain-containing protein n=1 Tax=Portibacter marinus TaxID=2898660 RepID=UPI001F24FA76|nr:PIN domain-containing protein [Portibacter marinus]